MADGFTLLNDIAPMRRDQSLVLLQYCSPNRYDTAVSISKNQPNFLAQIKKIIAIVI